MAICTLLLTALSTAVPEIVGRLRMAVRPVCGTTMVAVGAVMSYVNELCVTVKVLAALSVMTSLTT